MCINTLGVSIVNEMNTEMIAIYLSIHLSRDSERVHVTEINDDKLVDGWLPFHNSKYVTDSNAVFQTVVGTAMLIHLAVIRCST